MAGRMLQEMDADGDGSLGASEISVDQEVLTQADSDGDGKLSEAELIGLMNSMGPPPMDGQGMSGGQSLAGGQGTGGPGGAPPDASELFSSLDTDGDGVISQAEFLAGRPEEMSEDQAAEMWSRLDSEGVGSLSQEEFVTAMESQGPPPGPPPGGGAGASASSTDSGATSTDEAATVPSLNELLASLLANYGLTQYQQSQNGSLAASLSAGLTQSGASVNLTA
ncbi:MAG: EF-hand domain-containing protein [Pseudomonadota bacterium]